MPRNLSEKVGLGSALGSCSASTMQVWAPPSAQHLPCDRRVVAMIAKQSGKTLRKKDYLFHPEGPS